MAVHEVAQFTATKRLMIRAGIDINTVIQDGVWEDGYQAIVRDDNGKVLSHGDEVVTKFVAWPSREAGREIWESYKREAGLKSDNWLQ